MKIKQFEIWKADLNPQIGTETGNVRPVLIVQTDLLTGHPSIVICPITTIIAPESEILRVHLKKGAANLTQDSDIMIDQIRAIDKKTLTKKIGEVPTEIKSKVKENIKIILDID